MEKLQKQIDALCEQGNALADKRDFPAALTKFWAAWDLLPEPQTEWPAATWILGATEAEPVMC